MNLSLLITLIKLKVRPHVTPPSPPHFPHFSPPPSPRPFADTLSPPHSIRGPRGWEGVAWGRGRSGKRPLFPGEVYDGEEGRREGIAGLRLREWRKVIGGKGMRGRSSTRWQGLKGQIKEHHAKKEGEMEH